MTVIRGDYDELFAAVPQVLAGLLEGGDVGGAAAVFVDGEPVVDVWGGHADVDRTRPWCRDTIVDVCSVTKPMTALCVLLLADRGELDLDAPVARYWPQFAAAGKAGVLVRHVLAHTAGLPDWDGPTALEDLYDWPSATARLAAQAPQWEPGTAAGYHSLTQGFLLGEVVRRVTGATLGAFLAEELAGPLDADFRIGVRPEDDHRVAPLVPPPSRDEDYQAGAAGVPAGEEAGLTSGLRVRVRDVNSVPWRRAELPAVGGFGTARSVARVQALLADRRADGAARPSSPSLPSLSRAVRDRARQEQFAGVDRVLGVPMRYGLGYGLFGTACGWGGWGGSLTMVDPAAGMAVAYVTNQMREPGDDQRGLEIVMAAYDGLQGRR